MKIIFLGVGAAFSRQNKNSNVLIESGDVKLLIDCGQTAPSSIIEYGLGLQDITHILITHLHADHVGGMEEVALMTRLVFKTRITILATPSLLERLWEHSMKGGLEYLEDTSGYLAAQTLEDYFDVEQVPSNEWFSVSGASPLKIRLYATDHVKGMESYGLEFTDANDIERCFFFSGDSKFTPSLLKNVAESSGTLFHDCQLYDVGDSNEFGVHASYSQLLTLPPSIRSKMWLYHYDDLPLPNAKKDGFAGFITHMKSFK